MGGEEYVARHSLDVPFDLFNYTTTWDDSILETDNKFPVCIPTKRLLVSVGVDIQTGKVGADGLEPPTKEL